MRSLALGGNPGAAIRQYETFRRILAADMGMEPSTKTKNLVEQIRLGSLLSAEGMDDVRR